MGVAINIQIVSATGVGGVYPFVVVCFDGDVNNELYKTDATSGGDQAVWNHTFALDLTANIKSLLAAGRPEPTYLTFFIFDTGAAGVPSLGSAGVLLNTVRDHGRAQGDFPVVNGTGTLRVVVSSEKTKKGHGEGEHRFGLHDKKAKIAAGAGAAALAAGVAGLAVHHHKKKEREKEAEEADGGLVPPSPEGKKKKHGFLKSARGLLGGDSDSSDDEQAQGEGEGGGAAQVQRPSQSWWEDSSSSEGEAGGTGGTTREAPAVYVEEADAYQAHAGNGEDPHEQYSGDEGGDD